MQTANLFSAQSKVTTFAATTSAPTPVQLPNGGNTLRIVNEGTVGVFIAVGDTAATAIATLPSNGSVTSCYVAPNADVNFGIPDVPQGGPYKFVSAITRSGTATVEFYAGEGS